MYVVEVVFVHLGLPAGPRDVGLLLPNKWRRETLLFPIHVRGTLISISRAPCFPAQQLVPAANFVSDAWPWAKSRRAASLARRARSNRLRRLWSGRVMSTVPPPAHSDTDPLRDDGVVDRIMLHDKRGRKNLATPSPPTTPMGTGASPRPPQSQARRLTPLLHCSVVSGFINVARCPPLSATPQLGLIWARDQRAVAAPVVPPSCASGEFGAG